MSYICRSQIIDPTVPELIPLNQNSLAPTHQTKDIIVYRSGSRMRGGLPWGGADVLQE